MASKSVLLVSQQDGTTANSGISATYYQGLHAVINTNTSITEAQAAQTMRGAATVRNFKVRVSSNSRTTTTTVRSRKNTANGNLSVSIGSTATGLFEDNSNSDSIADGDTYCFQIVNGTGSSSQIIQYILAEMEMTSGNAANYYTALDNTLVSTSTASQTTYVPLCGDMTLVTTTDSSNSTRCTIPVAGTCSKLQCYVSANARTTTTTVKFRKNGADGNQSVSIGSTATGLFEDASNTDTVASGDELGYSLTTGTGANTITVKRMSVKFVGTADETALIAQRTTNGATGTRYGSPGARFGTTTTETDAQFKLPFDCSISTLTIRANWSTGTHTIKSRKNGANGNQSITRNASGTATVTDSSNSDSFTAGDLLGVEIALAGSTNLYHLAVRLSNPAPASARSRRIAVLNGF